MNKFKHLLDKIFRLNDQLQKYGLSIHLSVNKEEHIKDNSYSKIKEGKTSASNTYF
jgi:hypothetical protein